MQYFITILFYFSIQTLLFAAPLKDFTAHYNLYHNETYVGQTTRRLVTENKFATFSSIAKTDGFIALFVDVTITETSKLQYKNNQLNFFSYDFSESKNGKNKSYQLNIDKMSNVYSSHSKKRYPVTDNLQDTLGFTVALMHDMQKGKRDLKYTIAKKDKLKTYHLKFIAKEKITTDNGHIMTFKMEHYDPITKNRFTLWCAEDMNFLPVKIQKINHKGDENLLNLTQLNQKKLQLTLAEEFD